MKRIGNILLSAILSLVITLTGSGASMMLCAHNGVMAPQPKQHSTCSQAQSHQAGIGQLMPAESSCMTLISAKLAPTLHSLANSLDLATAVTALPQFMISLPGTVAAQLPQLPVLCKQDHAPPRHYLALLTILII